MSTIPTRRIVTGHDAAGRSVVVSDGPTPNQWGAPGDPILINFWATGGGRDPEADPAERAIPLGPAPGGATFRFFRVPPEKRTAHLTPEQREAQVAAYYAQVGAGAHIGGQRHAGFHKTQSVDFIVLLEGEVTLMLDEVDVPMKPYDVVVQRGTSHSWVNYGDESALLMAVLVDAPERT